jgi:hypothetical protein
VKLHLCWLKLLIPEIFAYLQKRLVQLVQSNQSQPIQQPIPQVPLEPVRMDQPIPQPVQQQKPQDNSESERRRSEVRMINYGVSKHQPQETQDRVEYHRRMIDMP